MLAQCTVPPHTLLQLGDLPTNLSGLPFEYELDGVHGHVHTGMLAAATYVHCCTHHALQEAAARCPDWPVLVTGHSLGGGVAALLAVLLHQTGLPQGLGPVHAICLATPAVMSEPLAAACERYSC